MFGINAPKYSITNYVLVRFKFKHMGREMVLTIPAIINGVHAEWMKSRDDGSLVSCSYKYDIFEAEVSKVSQPDGQSEFIVKPKVGTACQNIPESDIVGIANIDNVSSIEFAK